jgi:Ca-activated chloride channel family protein
MKKLIVVTTALLLVTMLLLSACSSSSRPAPTLTVPATSYAPVPPAPNYSDSITHGPSTTVPPMTTRAGPTYPATTSAPTYAPATTTPRATLPSMGGNLSAPPSTITQYPPVVTTPPNSGTIGLSAGGAKDIGNFRENIRNNYLPLPTDVTYEGLFYDYFFDTGATAPATKLFSPSYSYAVTRDPLSHQTEYYLSVGLNSGLKQSDFQRKKLNLVIVLDTSGSMGEYFNQYYYDGSGQQVDAYAGEGLNRPKKMDSAKASVVTILNQLDPGDRFAVVTFNSNAFLTKPMALAGNTNMNDVKNRIMDLNAGGSTNLTDGLDMAAGQFRNLREVSSYDYENRIIVLTDAEPNTGDFSLSGISSRMQTNAAGRIYTTFIGIGVDFNSQLVEGITKVKGANYYSVHSPAEFRQRMNDEFDYMVTPLVFNLQLNFESSGWRIDKVFGSPEANQSTGELMRINTMFPSKTEGGQTKGGLVLLKLRKTSSNPNEPVYLRVSYEDRSGRVDGSSQQIVLESTQPEYFDNTGIRKGVLLTRYASLLQNWMIDQRQYAAYSRPWDPTIREDTGIIIPVVNVSQWERQSLPLMVSEPYKRIFRDFSQYFSGEMAAIGDYSLDQELGILNTLTR